VDLTLSRRGDYALRAAVCLASAARGGQGRKIREVAAEAGLPRAFASQVLADLVRAGLVRSKAGKGGGYWLSRSPAAITLLEVVEAAEGALGGRQRPRPATPDPPPLGEAGGSVQRTFNAAAQALRQVLGATTLEAALATPGGALAGRVGEASSAAAPPASQLARPEDLAQHSVELAAQVPAPQAARDGQEGDCHGSGCVEDEGGERGEEGERSGLAGDPGHAPIIRPTADGEHRSTPWEHAELAATHHRVVAPDPPPRIRVLIVDDHALLRDGTVQLLARERDFEVVGATGTAEDALELLDHLRPDVALIDVNLPGLSGLALARLAAERFPDLRVLIVSAYDDYAYVVEALEVAVAGYLLKTSSGRELVDAVRAVASGTFVLDRAISRRLARRWRADPRDARSPLTRRETSVLRLLGRGLTNREIAVELGLGTRTIEGYVSNLRAKLGLASRTEAALYAATHLVDHEERHVGLPRR